MHDTAQSVVSDRGAAPPRSTASLVTNCSEARTALKSAVALCSVCAQAPLVGGQLVLVYGLKITISSMPPRTYHVLVAEDDKKSRDVA